MLSGVSPFLQSIAALPQATEVQPGQTYSAVVRVQNSALVMVSGQLLIPLDEGSGLVPGQRVSFQLNPSTTGLKLSITPESVASSAGASPPAPSLDRILTPILESLGKLGLAHRIHGAIPRYAPTTSTTLQPLLMVLLSERALGTDLAQFSQLLSSVASQGALGQGTAQAIAQWLGLVPPTGSEAWRAILLRSREEQSAAARIAASLKTETGQTGLSGLKESAAALAGRLLADTDFLQALDKEDLEPFKALAHRIQERATGADLQNLRSLDQSYQFLELPVPESNGFHRAQLHTFQDKSGPGREIGAPVHRTVLDLETTQLGALWVTLRSTGNQCACQFRVEDSAVTDLLQSEAPALEAALTAAGFAGATVSAVLWNGNREEALIALLAPYQKLDLDA
jgi:hypothetical protein